jgi:hypothetical protein
MIIGLTGLAGAGKSTAARWLSIHHGFVRRPMAYRLKSMIGVLGVDTDILDGDAARKEMPHSDLNGLTPRHAMQTLGTEWGRKCMGENFWVDLWMRDAKRVKNVVCDDVRFQNEVDAIRSLGGLIVKVERPCAGCKINPGHASEQAHLLPFDRVVSNDGYQDKLYTALDEIVAEMTMGAT